MFQAAVAPDTCYLDMSPRPWLQLYLPAVSFILPSAVIILLYLIIALTIFRKTRIRSRCAHSREER